MSDRRHEPENGEEESDLLDLVLRTAGWLALATGVVMLAFFLHWWRAQG